MKAAIIVSKANIASLNIMERLLEDYPFTGSPPRLSVRGNSFEVRQFDSEITRLESKNYLLWPAPGFGVNSVIWKYTSRSLGIIALLLYMLFLAQPKWLYESRGILFSPYFELFVLAVVAAFIAIFFEVLHHKTVKKGNNGRTNSYVQAALFGLFIIISGFAAWLLLRIFFEPAIAWVKYLLK